MVITDEQQHLNVKFNKKGETGFFWESFIYAKNKENLRVPLWDSLRFHQKLKLLTTALSNCSRAHIGNVYDNVKEWKGKMQTFEVEYIDNIGEDAREDMHHAQANYTKWLRCEQSILRQKANVRWLDEGDSNSKYFHAPINDKRKRLTLHKIRDQYGQWITSYRQISKAVVQHFENIFKSDEPTQIQGLECIDRLITEEDNDMLTAIPNEEEIKNVVFAMDPNSCPGPDGYGGVFYQSCWTIIKKDLIDFVQSYFNGAALTKFYTSNLFTYSQN
ncbi:uncharacterized protein LOC132057966 [Lycium ferocissimum]|uniref:uncharacterized protein LOC132057966 n=1 Tax=Lycium ferocissimum TaxID=112874 RepID=UPI002814C687|nr:uncharacterized protein LOC132057966 [Lycium ferocissimum]